MWEPVKRKDVFQGSDEAFVAFAIDRISFNAAFVKKANISNFKRVSVFVDKEEKKLGFSFHNDKKQDSYALFESRGSKNLTARGIIKQFPWVGNIAKKSEKRKRRLIPVQEKDLWVVQFPA